MVVILKQPNSRYNIGFGVLVPVFKIFFRRILSTFSRSSRFVSVTPYHVSALVRMLFNNHGRIFFYNSPPGGERNQREGERGRKTMKREGREGESDMEGEGKIRVERD